MGCLILCNSLILIVVALLAVILVFSTLGAKVTAIATRKGEPISNSANGADNTGSVPWPDTSLIVIEADSPRETTSCTVPQLAMPSNDRTLSTLRPYFSWAFESVLCDDLDLVLFELALDPAFTDVVITESSPPPGALGYQLWNTNLDPATTYYWRVSWWCGGIHCPYSETWSFTTGSGGVILLGPALQSPVDGSTVTSTTVTFDWEPLSGATEYFLHVERLGWWRERLVFDGSGSTMEDLLPDRTYTWWVKGVNDYAFGDPSETWTFTTSSEWGGQIEEIEINQVLGRQVSDPPKFVAGKLTAIRVFLSEPVVVNPAAQSVVVKQNDDIVATLRPQPATHPVTVLDFGCTNTATSCAGWPEGDFNFEVTVNGAKGQITVSFQERKGLHILAVPVKVKDGSVVKQLPDDSWKTAWRFLNHVYPVSLAGVDWKLGEELDATDLDLTDDDDKIELLERLENLQAKWYSGSARYDKIVGFIPPALIIVSAT